MSKEDLQPEQVYSNSAKESYKYVPHVARGALAVAGLGYGVYSGAENSVEAYHDTNYSESGYVTLSPSFPDSGVVYENQPDETNQEPWDRDEIRVAIGFALAYSVSAGIQTHRLSKKYDENTLRNIKDSASIAMVASMSALAVDSLPDVNIDNRIAVGFFVGHTALRSAASIYDSFSRHKDPVIRKTAVANAAFLTSAACTLLYAVDKLS